MLDSKQSILDLQWHLLALRVIVKFARLERAARKYGYNPNQPRAPAGVYDGATPIGGRWIGNNLGTQPPSRIRVAVSAFDNPGLYYVDLAEEDRKGGHGFSKHVGKSAGYLKAYVIAWNMNPANKHHPTEGSFHSLGEANNLVSTVLRAHPEVVSAAMRGGTNLPITHRLGYDTGYEAFQPVLENPPVIRTTYWVEVYITHDSRPNSRGYRVVTAYPMNDTPNEVPAKSIMVLEQ